VFLSVPPAVARREHRGTRDTTPGLCSRSPTSSCRRCTSASAADARLEERDRSASGTIDPGSKERLWGADSVVRADDVEAFHLPLVGEVMGPGGPITWLPTLNRGREGLQMQSLMRVVTDTPVTTLAVAKATRESGGERSLALAYRPRVTLRRVSRGGSREVRRTAAGLVGPTGRISPGRRSSRRPVAPWKLRWRPAFARSGSSRDVRSLLRQTADRRAIARPELLVPLLQAPCVARGHFSNARIERDARVSQPGDPLGPRTDHPARRRDRVHSGNGDQATTAARPLKRGKVGV
jgi:hypothetical protein